MKLLPILLVLYVMSPIAPELVAPGIISTGDSESAGTVSPDGEVIFFTKRSPSTLSSSTVVICFSTKKDGKWSKPEVAPFSGIFKDYNPSFSPDGNKLFFISTRPRSAGEKTFDSDIWVVEKNAIGWSEPKNIGAPVNTPQHEISCSVSSDGTLYFSSTRDGKSVDLYYSTFVDGKYSEPKSIDGINTPGTESEPAIAPDRSFMLFTSVGREDGIPSEGAEYPRSDLYLSFYENGSWSTPRIAGVPVNSAADESNAFISSDGRTLYFTSKRNFVTIPMKDKLTYLNLDNRLKTSGNGLADIYKIDLSSVIKK